MIELTVMGVIAGYYIPYWFGRLNNPHTRNNNAKIEDYFPPEIGLGNTLFDETLIIYYDIKQQETKFYSKWF